MEVNTILSSIPHDEWVGKTVRMLVGVLAGKTAKVLKEHSGWVTLDATYRGHYHHRRPNELCIVDENSNDTNDTLENTIVGEETIDFNSYEDMLCGMGRYLQDSNECVDESNLDDVVPHEGMRVEIRDKDFIWSAASIHRINNDNTVTIRYDGWGDEWDEILPYPSPRLARIFTYTKEVKCLAEVFPKRKGANVWPCKVQFRMAHPHSSHAHALLRMETNIFISPYGHNLPSQLVEVMENKGLWIDTKKIHFFSCNVESTVKYFDEALNEAMKDDTDVIPDGALEEGTLVSEKYRVGDYGSGGTSAMEYMPEYKRQKLDNDDISDDEIALDFPPPTIITQPFPNIYCDSNTKKITVITYRNGNELSLGTFPSLSKALNKPMNRYEAAKSIPISSIVDAFNNGRGKPFRVGKWARSVLKVNGPEERVSTIGKRKGRKDYVPKRMI